MKKSFQLFQQWVDRHLLTASITLMLLALLVLFFWNRIFITIYPGERGVLFKRLGNGTDTEHVYTEGTSVIMPWNVMYKYSVREQIYSDTVDAITVDGLRVQVQFTVNFHPNKNQLPMLHKTVGETYVRDIIVPEASAAVREVISQYRPEELYAARRATIQDQLLSKVRIELGSRYLVFDDILIRSIELPVNVRKAIELKIEQFHLAQSYEYRLKTEALEAQRKHLEAVGISDFNKTSGISILKWKGLEVTQNLAASPNTKIIVVGPDQKDLPILMGND